MFIYINTNFVHVFAVTHENQNEYNRVSNQYIKTA